MKTKLNRAILFGVLLIASVLVSCLSVENSYADKLSSVACGVFAVIFIGALFEYIAAYRKSREQAG